MKEGNIYKAFNARWISPENVARKFVRTPQFSSLIGPDNCVLAGPRGCGKTTLLKMLTSRAQHVWGTEVLKTRKKVEPYTVSFEAIYIPSDIRWSYELRAMVFDLGQDDLAEICQRVLVTSNSIRCALGVFDDILKRNNSSSIETETILSKKVMSMFSLTGTIPSLSECSGLLRAISSNIKGLINLKEIERLKEYIKGLNPSLFSDVLDPIIGVCNIFNEVVEDSVKIAKWGICYDEVEIAPTWFGNELFAALRSLSDQNFLLKFTWSPILPSRTPSGAEIAEDYDPVKLWSSEMSPKSLK